MQLPTYAFHIVHYFNNNIIPLILKQYRLLLIIIIPLFTNSESNLKLNIILCTDPFPAPTNLHLEDINREKVVFSWSSIAINCSSLQYDIKATGTACACPKISISTSFICLINNSMLNTNGTKCNVAIRTVVCSNLTGTWSSPTEVFMKGNDTHCRDLYDALILYNFYCMQINSSRASNYYQY